MYIFCLEYFENCLDEIFKYKFVYRNYVLIRVSKYVRNFWFIY